MNFQDMALISAGTIGVLVSILHGALSQRLMVAPMAQLIEADGRMALSTRRLVPVLMQFSTFNWFVSGIALIAAGLWLGQEARMVAAVFAGSSYLVGAVGNCWGTRGRHPGWVLLAAACVLIALGVLSAS